MDFSQIENTDLAKTFNNLYQQNKMAEALNKIYTPKKVEEQNAPVDASKVLPKSLYDSAVSNLQETNKQAQEHGFGLFDKSLENRDTMQKRTTYTNPMLADTLNSIYSNVVSSMESAMGRRLRGGEALVAMKYAAGMLGNYLGLQDKNNSTLGNFLQQQEDTDTNLFDKLSKSSYFGKLTNNAKGLLDVLNTGKQIGLLDKYKQIDSLLNFFEKTKPVINAENPIGPAEQQIANRNNPAYNALINALGLPDTNNTPRTNLPTDLTSKNENPIISTIPEKPKTLNNNKSFENMFNEYLNMIP